jgi:hypothetical protein
MFKVTCPVDPQRKVGTSQKLGLESPQKNGPDTVLHIVKQTQAINQKNATNLSYMTAQK